MGLFLRLRYLLVVSLLCWTQTYASQMNILVQRNCDGGDLKLTSGSPAVYTACVWKPNESEGMQVSLRLSTKVDFIAGYCTFEPATNQTPDRVIDVRSSKSGRSNGSVAPLGVLSGYYLISGNHIKFVVRNFNSYLEAPSEYPSHVNISFYLENKRYTPGDAIHCEFTPI